MRSPLHEVNQSLGARFTDFGGWEMPLQYDSVIAEHKAVRSKVGVFDVTHLGRFALSGEGAQPAVRSLLCNDINRVEPGKCQYTMMLNSEGGVVDDLIVWWREDGDFWIMPNAVNQQRVMATFAERDQTDVRDLQTTSVFLAVQGPEAISVLDEVFGGHPQRFRNTSLEWRGGGSVTAAGTGYTGEAGAELCVGPRIAPDVMRSLVAAGAKPCGLGARDTLRLETGYPLWGADLDEETTPFEAGLDFAVSMDHDFIGRQRLAEQEELGLAKRMTGISMTGKGIPRSGYAVVAAESSGVVTSGNMSPMLGNGIALAYMSPPTFPGTPVSVDIRGRSVTGTTVDPPFHR